MHLQTGEPLRSACNCISKLFNETGPSTFNFRSFEPIAVSIASKISWIWKQIDSKAARMI